MGLWGLVSVSRCWQEGGGVTELVSKIALLAFLRGCVVAVIEEPNNRLVDDAHRLLQYCVMSFRPAHVVFVLIS
jgi:hypothetical protein